jgi:hypothetical protein
MTQSTPVHNRTGSRAEYTEIPLLSGRFEQLFRKLFERR